MATTTEDPQPIGFGDPGWRRGSRTNTQLVEAMSASNDRRWMGVPDDVSVTDATAQRVNKR